MPINVNVVGLFESESGYLTWQLHHDQATEGIAFSSDGNLVAVGTTPDDKMVDGKLVTATEPGTVRVWDTRTGRLMRTLEGQAGGVTKVAIASNSRLLVSAGAKLPLLRFWDLETGRPLAELALLGTVGGLAFAPDNNILAVAMYLGQISTVAMDAARGAIGQPQQSIRIAAAPEGLAFSHLGRRLAVLTDTTVEVWDLDSAKQIQSWQYHRKASGRLHMISFSPDDRRLLVDGEDTDLLTSYPGNIDQADLGALAEHFGKEQIVELAAVLATTNRTNRLNGGLQVPLT